MYNIEWIYKNAKVILNLSEKTFKNVQKVCPNSILQFFYESLGTLSMGDKKVAYIDCHLVHL